jgi:membrane protease YdiL (CAAX protease family)
VPDVSAVRPVDEAFARKLRGFGPLGVLAFVVITALGPVLEPLGTVLVLAWVSASETSWRELGFVRPKSWVRSATFNEETVFRGFVFERLGNLLGHNLLATIGTVLVSSAWFAAVHYLEQGVAGVEQAAMTGLAFGTVFAVTRQIWIPMIALAAYDLSAIAIIYWNIESTMAHLVFR